MTMRGFFIFFFLWFAAGTLFSQEYRRWEMNEDGSISWHIRGNIPHDDHIEMSGKRISSIIRYGVAADGSFHATRSLVWPLLRTIPNNTHASLTRRFAQDGFDLVTWRGLGLIETLPALGVVMAFAVGFAAIALARFRWED